MTTATLFNYAYLPDPARHSGRATAGIRRVNLVGDGTAALIALILRPTEPSLQIHFW